MIYADYNSTSLLDEEVKTYLTKRINEGIFSNPSSLHALGRHQKYIIENCRKVCAKSLGASPNQVIFTSGATESIAMIFNQFSQEKKEIISSEIEHNAVLENLKLLKKQGCNISYFDTHENGVVDLRKLKTQKIIDLACLMAVNNETGVIQSYLEFAKTCHSLNILSFVDLTQLIGKQKFVFESSNIDFACLSGHKLGALPGIGILLIKNPLELNSLIRGGKQEHGLRAGTENYIGIESLAIVMNNLDSLMKKYSNLENVTIEFEKKLKEKIPNIKIFGDESERVSGTTLFSIPGLMSQAIQIELESNGIFVSTSAACSDNEPETSHVLRAMNIDDKYGRGVIRLSLPPDENEYNQILEKIVSIYLKLSKIGNFFDNREIKL